MAGNAALVQPQARHGCVMARSTIMPNLTVLTSRARPVQLSDAGPGMQTGTPPRAGLSRGGLSSSNTLLAEAARHLREQKAREAEAARREEQLRAAEDGASRSPGAALSYTAKPCLMDPHSPSTT